MRGKQAAALRTRGLLTLEGMKMLQAVLPPDVVMRPWQFWSVAALYWGSFALVGYAQSTAYWSLAGSPWFTRTELLELLLRVLLWWASTPLILYLAYRAPLTSFRRLGRHLALHVAAQLTLNLLITCGCYLLLYWLGGLAPGRTWGPAGIWASMLLRLSISLAMYLLLVVGYGVVSYAFRNQALRHQNVRYELLTAQLKSQLAEAQLQTLKMQLNPHFLFNAHHTIIGLILEQEPERAIAVVTSLSELLRAVLVGGDAQLIPLRDEWKLVQQYLHIQQIRFQDRLHIAYELAADTHECPFPSFLLQPLVENAIVHSVEQSAGEAHLCLRTHREGPYLVVEVRDHGGATSRPAKPSPRSHTGIGLGNATARLEKLYQGRAQLEFAQPATGGTVVRVRVPFAGPAAEPAPALSTTLAAV